MADPHPIEVTPEQASARRLDGAVLLDVRRHDELETASINGAAHVPMQELEARADEVREMAEERDVIVFCHHGVRSLRATNFLRGQGIENVSSMAGGIDAWSLGIDPGVPRY